MKISKLMAVMVAALVCAGTASAQKQGERMMTQPHYMAATSEPAATNGPSNVRGGKSTVFSNLKSRGFIGPFEIVAVRERGFFGPSTVGTFIYDTRSADVALVNTASSPGVGIAIVNGGALVGASYLFGHSLRPDQNQISNGSSSSATGNGGQGGSAVAHGGQGGNATGGTATGGTANAAGGNSSATGGSSVATGGSSASNAMGGSSTSNSNATGGYGGNGGTGGNGGGGGTGGAGGGHQHPASPGNGGTPGNGGQNGNGHHP